MLCPLQGDATILEGVLEAGSVVVLAGDPQAVEALP